MSFKISWNPGCSVDEIDLKIKRDFPQCKLEFDCNSLSYNNASKYLVHFEKSRCGKALSEYLKIICEGMTSCEERFEALKNPPNGQAPGN